MSRPYEYCTLCDRPTGGAGKDEDSNYIDKYGDNELGPLCDCCYDHLGGNEQEEEE